jgi:hypothetical protein
VLSAAQSQLSTNQVTALSIGLVFFVFLLLCCGVKTERAQGVGDWA